MPWTPGTPVEIRTPRYLMRSARREDVTDEYVSWFKDPETMRYVGPDVGRFSNEEHLKVVSSADNRTRIILTVENAADARAIGWVRIQLEPRHKRAQSSTVIGSATHRGLGGMIERGRAVKDFLFQEADVQKLTLITYGANTWVLNHLEKNPNAVREAVLTRHDWVPGLGWQDVHVFAMFREKVGLDLIAQEPRP